MLRIASPLVGTVVQVHVRVGQVVRSGTELCVIESMKMEHPIVAECEMTITAVLATIGEKVGEGTVLLEAQEATSEVSPKLAQLEERRAKLDDAARPTAAVKRHERGQRTVRENIADMFDDGTFVEYGGFAVAAQRKRRSVEDLIDNTPADGLVTGIGLVDGQRCAVLAYDYTVLAGTQGHTNHKKKDRLFELAERLRLPVVFFTEGGGGRPGDTDMMGVSGLDCLAFLYFAELSGLVPIVGVNAGYCFAGNAAILGCCDVVIATADSNIGMGGPAMIEGGGLGVFDPKEIGPVDVQRANGVIDIVVPDEAAAVAAAKQYLGYFQGPVDEWSCVDQRELRHVIPDDRKRSYDVHQVLQRLFDTGSLLELRRDFAQGAITTLARVDGRSVGIIANVPAHLGGAIDASAADKFARFIQLCDACDLPIVSLCDTPGFMVGPEAETTGQVRHFARLFVTAASITVPWITVVVRKGYGLGAQAMAAGSFHAATSTVAWPTGEFGGMGLEGAVRLGYRKELDAAPDEASRAALEERLIAAAYEQGAALNMAMHIEIDDVIDPRDTRRTLAWGLEISEHKAVERPHRKRGVIPV